MLSFILIGAAATAFGIISIIAKASPSFLKKILGYEVYIDLSLSVLISLYVALSGTISGIVIGAITGIFIGATLFVAARTIGYQKLERNEQTGKMEWVSYPPVWTLKTFKNLLNNKWSKLTAPYQRKVI